jgi:ribosomal protein L37AE/L43A
VTRVSSTLWTCDRCGATATTNTSQQPKWLGVVFGAPPEADPTESKWARKHLCPTCDTKFAVFLRPITRDAEETP